MFFLAFAVCLASGLLMFVSIWFAVVFVIGWTLGVVASCRILWRLFHPEAWPKTRMTIVRRQ
jgi:hypothetical protein